MKYNISIQTIQTNIAASQMKFGKKELFEAPPAKREAPKVWF